MLTSTPRNRTIRIHDASYDVSKCWKYETNETTLDKNYSTETCSNYSTGYESASSAWATKTSAYESCTKRAGAFSNEETVKTNGKSKYTYYCQTNTWSNQQDTLCFMINFDKPLVLCQISISARRKVSAGRQQRQMESIAMIKAIIASKVLGKGNDSL